MIAVSSMRWIPYCASSMSLYHVSYIIQQWRKNVIVIARKMPIIKCHHPRPSLPVFESSKRKCIVPITHLNFPRVIRTMYILLTNWRKISNYFLFFAVLNRGMVNAKKVQKDTLALGSNGLKMEKYRNWLL